MASYCWTLLLVLVITTRGQTAAINKRPVTAIQPISCASKSGEVGVCMFAWHCMLFKGKHLSACFDGFFVGSCCLLPPSSTPGPSNEVLPMDPVPNPTRRPEPTSSVASATLDWRPVTSTSFVTSIPDLVQSEPDDTNYSLDPTTTVVPTTTSSELVNETGEQVTDSQLVNSEFINQSNINEPPKENEVPTTFNTSDTTSSTELATINSTEDYNTETVTAIVTEQVTASSSATTVPTTAPTTAAPPIAATTISTPTTSSRKPTFSTSPKPVTVRPIPVPPTTTQFPQSELEHTTLLPNKTTVFQQNYKEVCGKPVLGPRGRIVGGENAHYAEWPWMISLRQWKKNTFLHKCGAALLNGQWAITAAHCVESVSASDILLRIGEFDVSNDKEPESYEERRVQIVASHHKFDPRTFEYDVALLRFYQPVRFRRNILPICIPHGNDDYVGKMATVTGWGRLYEDGPLPSVMQEVQVPVITNLECESMYKKAGFVEDIPDIFICAGKAEGGKDSCEGDSGGPMVLKDSDGRWVLAGIISWGIGCALPNQPGVYTRITKFANWIESIIVH